MFDGRVLYSIVQPLAAIHSEAAGQVVLNNNQEKLAWVFAQAEKQFGVSSEPTRKADPMQVPKLIDTGDFIQGKVDDKSVILYLSYLVQIYTSRAADLVAYEETQKRLQEEQRQLEEQQLQLQELERLERERKERQEANLRAAQARGDPFARGVPELSVLGKVRVNKELEREKKVC